MNITTDSCPSSVHPELHALFDDYEKCFFQALRKMPERRPWVPQERTEILSLVRSNLGIQSSWIPEINFCGQAISEFGDFVVEHYQSVSWPDVYGAADLYLPKSFDQSSMPVAIIACGHGKGGKRAPGYRRMAEHLVRQRIAVLVSDNIGQGERTPMGHWDVVDVFACGLSLQGLIVMETMGWLNWLKGQSRFDSARIAVIGNSGGGTLSMFLGALCRDDLVAVSCSGYPSTFEFIARKEKKHCHCNLLPGFVGELEMWQILGCIAPKPLLLFQGKLDNFFPNDLFWHVARKVALAYEMHSAIDAYMAEITDGGHAWDFYRRRMLAQFVCQACSVPFDSALVDETNSLPELPPCYAKWPSQARDADAIARHLTGYTGKTAQQLWEVIKPDAASMQANLMNLRGDARQVLAQFELFLKKPLRPNFI